jgi:hypothetical protein
MIFGDGKISKLCPQYSHIDVNGEFSGLNLAAGTTHYALTMIGMCRHLKPKLVIGSLSPFSFATMS